MRTKQELWKKLDELREIVDNLDHCKQLEIDRAPNDIERERQSKWFDQRMDERYMQIYALKWVLGEQSEL